MAFKEIPAKQWAKAKEYFEAGLSLAKIEEKTGISRGQLSKRSNAEGWQKGLPQGSGSALTPCPTCLYLITAEPFGDLFKIGLASDVSQRLSQMQTGCPYPLFAFREYKTANAMPVEKMLHAFFHKKRRLGEWFELTSTDICYIDQALLGGGE